MASDVPRAQNAVESQKAAVLTDAREPLEAYRCKVDDRLPELRR